MRARPRQGRRPGDANCIGSSVSGFPRSIVAATWGDQIRSAGPTVRGRAALPVRPAARWLVPLADARLHRGPSRSRCDSSRLRCRRTSAAGILGHAPAEAAHPRRVRLVRRRVAAVGAPPHVAQGRRDPAPAARRRRGAGTGPAGVAALAARCAGHRRAGVAALLAPRRSAPHHRDSPGPRRRDVAAGCGVGMAGPAARRLSHDSAARRVLSGAAGSGALPLSRPHRRRRGAATPPAIRGSPDARRHAGGRSCCTRGSMCSRFSFTRTSSSTP